MVHEEASTNSMVHEIEAHNSEELGKSSLTIGPYHNIPILITDSQLWHHFDLPALLERWK